MHETLKKHVVACVSFHAMSGKRVRQRKNRRDKSGLMWIDSIPKVRALPLARTNMGGKNTGKLQSCE